jgi:hypothetical protein
VHAFEVAAAGAVADQGMVSGISAQMGDMLPKKGWKLCLFRMVLIKSISWCKAHVFYPGSLTAKTGKVQHYTFPFKL